MSIVNSLLVRWAGGFVELADSSSVTTYDRREGLLDAGDLGDADAIFRLADQNLSLTKDPTTSIVARIEDVSASSGYSVYTDFGLGDTVTAPARGGGTQSVRLVGVTCNEDGDGNLEFDTEFETVRDLAEERVQRWLSRTANGTLDGRSPTPTVSVSSPSIVSSSVVTPDSVDFQTLDGAAVGDTAGPGKTSGKRGFAYAVELNTATAGTGDTTFAITINGSAWCSASLGASETTEFYQLSYSEVRLIEPTDIISVDFTADGGATLVGIRVIYTPLES